MKTFTHWRFYIDQQNIGWLELDVAGTSVNVLQREVMREWAEIMDKLIACLLYSSPSPRDLSTSRMPSSA